MRGLLFLLVSVLYVTGAAGLTEQEFIPLVLCNNDCKVGVPLNKCVPGSFVNSCLEEPMPEGIYFLFTIHSYNEEDTTDDLHQISAVQSIAYTDDACTTLTDDDRSQEEITTCGCEGKTREGGLICPQRKFTGE
eukprot:TRINITY_DN2932_c0_g2_i1.p1 TRINITY_DN2932_c0_g2~~TRINITY_DN2932_c0_g2_i1.p1  ORF type:complete len:134 (+),score=21.24 TRINITY_DN2932_c0_g2_i1:168-569(+)